MAVVATSDGQCLLWPTCRHCPSRYILRSLVTPAAKRSGRQILSHATPLRKLTMGSPSQGS